MPILIGLFIGYRWGLPHLGAFTVASASLTVALVITDWGATRALPRNLATLTPEAAIEFLASGNTFRLLLFAGAIAIGAVMMQCGVWNAEVKQYVVILIPVCVATMLATNALSERIVAGETVGIGWAVAVGVIVFASLAAVAIALQLGPRAFVAAYVCGKIAEAAVMARGRWWVAVVGRTSVAATAAILWPFGMHMILAALYSRLAVFTVERMTNPTDLGVFSVAVALNSAMLLVPTSVALFEFPAITRAMQRGDVPRVRRTVAVYSLLSVATVLFGIGGLWLFAGRIGRALRVPSHHEQFLVAYASVALVTIFSSMAVLLMQARGQERPAAWIAAAILVVGAIYQVISLKLFGLWGIVLGVAAGEITTVLAFSYGLWRTRGKAVRIE